MSAIQPFSVVALLEDLPATNLRRGQVGTVVEHLDASVLEIDFSDDEGRTYATAAVDASQLLVLLHEPTAA